MSQETAMQEQQAAAARKALPMPTRRHAARTMYAESVTAGMPMTDAELGEAFGLSARWSRQRIAEVRAELAKTAGLTNPAGADAQPDETTNETTNETTEEALSADTDRTDARPSTGLDKDAAPPTVPIRPTGRPAGRVVSWLAFLLGITATVAANVAHKFYPTADQVTAWHQAGNTGDYQPEIGAVIGAAFWPLALLAAVEVLGRVDWPAGGWWRLARYGGMGTVAGVAALISYRHMAGLLTAWGEDELSAHLGPLAVDGLMVLAGFALLSISARRDARSGTGRRP